MCEVVDVIKPIEVSDLPWEPCHNLGWGWCGVCFHYETSPSRIMVKCTNYGVISYRYPVLQCALDLIRDCFILCDHVKVDEFPGSIHRCAVCRLSFASVPPLMQ